MKLNNHFKSIHWSWLLDVNTVNEAYGMFLKEYSVKCSFLESALNPKRKIDRYGSIITQKFGNWQDYYHVKSSKKSHEFRGLVYA